MNIVIKRYQFNENNVIGKLYIDNEFFAFTLEDKVRVLNSAADKVKNATAIPYGTYKAIVSDSFRFKRELPELLDVPYFTKIRMHGGNDQNDSEGCILVGANTNNMRIWNCKGKVDELTRRIKAAGGCSVEVVREAV